MDGVNDAVRPPLPVIGGPKMMVIPRGAFEQSATIREGHEPKLAGARFEVIIQMRRMDLAVGRPLLQRGGILFDREFQEAWFIPYFDGFHEWAGREIAMTHRAHAAPGNFRAN